MVKFNLTERVVEHYGNAHYLFRVINHNGFVLPVDWQYGDTIKLPARGNRRRLADAERRRRTMTYNPVGDE